MTDILTRLPKELQIYIWEYDPEHRVKLNKVLDELDYIVNWTDCYNDRCEKPIHKLDKDTIVAIPLFNNLCYFCNEDCCSYGTWSMRYDYRKSMRNRNRNR